MATPQAAEPGWLHQMSIFQQLGRSDYKFVRKWQDRNQRLTKIDWFRIVPYDHASNKALEVNPIYMSAAEI